MSFYVAIFMALLLLVSGGLNLLLLVVSAFGSATAGISSAAVAEEDGRYFELVAVGGDRGARESILRLPIDGAIAEASSPLIGATGGTVSQVRRSLAAAASDDGIKAVLLDINSPGGGVTDSDEIWRLIVKFRTENPDIKVVALLGDMAASGGYYIAAACDAIMARPTTITGSIGVIISNYNLSRAMDKLGIDPIAIISKDTPYKDMLSMSRAMTPKEEEKILAIVQEMYERFVDIVDEGRPELTREQVKSAATGEIYSAQRALEIGLVDEIADIDEAVAQLTQMAGLESARLVEYRRIPTLFDALFGVKQQPAFTLEHAAAHLMRHVSGPKFLYFWPGGR